MFSDKNEGFGGLLVVIVLVVLFAAFSRGGLGAFGGERGLVGESAADAIAINRQASFTDPDMARLMREQAVDTGVLRHDIDDQTCKIKDELARNHTATVREIAEEARRADDRSYRAEIDRWRDETEKGRLREAELGAKILHQETLRAIADSECRTDRRLDHIECRMLKAAPAFGITETVALERDRGPRRFYEYGVA